MFNGSIVKREIKKEILGGFVIDGELRMMELKKEIQKCKL